MARAKTDQEAHPEKYFNNPEGHIRDRIIIHESERLPKEGLFISLNGYPFLAKPGVPVDIPRPVRRMLDTRIETQTIQDDNGKDYTRDIPRITYTLLVENVTTGKIPSPEALPVDLPDMEAESLEA
jgi:hypothetical protein